MLNSDKERTKKILNLKMVIFLNFEFLNFFKNIIILNSHHNFLLNGEDRALVNELDQYFSVKPLLHESPYYNKKIVDMNWMMR